MCLFMLSKRCCGCCCVVDFDIVAAGRVPVDVADDVVGFEAARDVDDDVFAVALYVIAVFAVEVADDVVAHVVADDVVKQHWPIHQQLFDFNDL